MALPTCPDLTARAVTTNTASGSLAHYIDAFFTSLTAVTDDAGVAIPAACQYQVTKEGASAYVVFEPAATSPVANKWVGIVAGAAAAIPNAAAMVYDTATASMLYFGLWMANTSGGALQSVSRADLTAAWTAAAPFTGNGTFSGYMKLYGTGLTSQKAIVFPTPDTVGIQLETTALGVHGCELGMGIRGVSTAAASSEAGMLGRMFGLCTSGSSNPMAANWHTANNAGLLKHYVNDGQWHSAYRIPAATASPMRACSWCPNGAVTPVGWPSSTANFCLGAGGDAEPEVVALKDVVGSGGGRDNMTIGRHRSFFWGPRRKSRAYVTTAGAKRWISFGSSLTTDNDNFVMPGV